MDKKELEKEIVLPYHELVEYLRNKYGEAEVDYFRAPECRTRNSKVSRTNEGLLCHHIREDVGVNLSDPEYAKTQPFEWQQKENLVYCDYLEHLILHIKISIMRQKTLFSEVYDVESFFRPGGIYFIFNEVNDAFFGETKSLGRKRCFDIICNDYEEYVLILSSLLLYLRKQCDWTKDKEPFLKIGAAIEFKKTRAEVVKISDDRQTVLLRYSDGREAKYSTICGMRSFQDSLDQILGRLCRGYNGYYSKLYEDVSNCNSTKVKKMADALSVDFRGYGFPHFSKYKLDAKQFGAENIDHYLYKALPSFSNPDKTIRKKKPHFWLGKIPQKVIKDNLYFVVRIKVSFNIKPGEEAFVKYKERDAFRNKGMRKNPAGLEEQLGIAAQDYVVLETSDLKHSTNQEKCSTRVNKEGKIEWITVNLTLSKDDLILFFKRHDIRYLKYLDGCYFDE